MLLEYSGLDNSLTDIQFLSHTAMVFRTSLMLTGTFTFVVSFALRRLPRTNDNQPEEVPPMPGEVILPLSGCNDWLIKSLPGADMGASKPFLPNSNAVSDPIIFICPWGEQPDSRGRSLRII
jgi:hypothetical protein